MGHFSVDVDVDSLRAAQRWLGTMADEAPREAKGIEGAPDDLAEWTGPAADKIKQEMRDLGAALTGFGPSFGDARDAVKAFADAAETFEDVTVPDYNRRYDQLNTDAETDMGAADRRAEDAPDGETPAGPTRGEIANGLRYALQGLQHEFEEEKKELKRKAQTLSSSLAGTSPIDVPESAVTSFTSGGGTAAEISTWPTVSPEASQSMRVDVTAEDIDAFDFSDMTEEERRQFNEDNPGVLDDLMSTDPPSAHLKDQVYHLGVPKVDGEDADSDTDAIDGAINDHYGQDRFAEGFETTEEFQRYAAWAEQYNVVEPFDEGQRDYLSRFNDYLWENREDVSRYIDETHLKEVGYTGADGYQSSLVEQEFGEEDRQRLNALVADSYLMESNHRLGGGYDQLPEEMREAIEQRPETDWTHDVPVDRPNDDFLEVAEILTRGSLMPGDGLAKHLAMNASDSLDWATSGTGNNDYPVETMGDVIALAARNREASADLITGDDMPADFNPREFLEPLYTHQWDDKGARVAELTDWVGDDLRQDPPDPRAQDVYDSLMDSLVSQDDDDPLHGNIYREVLEAQSSDDGEAANSALIRGLADLTRNSWALERLSAQESTLTEGERMRLFTLMATDDHAAALMSASSQAYVADLVAASEPGQDVETISSRAARLTGFVDAGVYNAAALETHDADDIRQTQHDVAMAGLGLLTQFDKSGILNAGASLIPGPSPGPAADADLPPGWDNEGRHVMNSYYQALLESRLDEDGTLDGQPLPDEITNPQDYEPAQRLDAYKELLGNERDDLDAAFKNSYDSNLWNGLALEPDQLSRLIDHGDLPMNRSQ